MSAIFLQWVLPNLLEIFSAIAMTALSALLLKLREKKGIEVSDDVKKQLHAALLGAIKDIIVRFIGSGGSMANLNVPKVIAEAANQVIAANPALIKQAKTATFSNLVKVASRHVPEAVRDVVGYQMDNAEVMSALSPPPMDATKR